MGLASAVAFVFHFVFVAICVFALHLYLILTIFLNFCLTQHAWSPAGDYFPLFGGGDLSLQGPSYGGSTAESIFEFQLYSFRLGLVVLLIVHWCGFSGCFCVLLCVCCPYHSLPLSVAFLTIVLTIPCHPIPYQWLHVQK